jgi:hypothetical protein
VHILCVRNFLHVTSKFYIIRVSVNVDSTVFVQNVRVYVLSPYQVSHIGVSDSLAATNTETQRVFLRDGWPVVLHRIKILL